MTVNNCRYCGKFTKNKKYCSYSCNGRVNVVKTNRLNKINHTGYCHNSKLQSKAGKIGGKSRALQMEITNTGLYNSDIRLMGAKAGGAVRAKQMKATGTGLYNPNNWKKGNATCIRLRVGWFSKKHQSMAGKLGIIKALKSRRINSNIKLYNICFDSNFEKEIALCLLRQEMVNKLLFRKNVFVKIGSKEYDFYINKYDCYLEPHAAYWTKDIDYYADRKDNLINNKVNSNLVILKW